MLELDEQALLAKGQSTRMDPEDKKIYHLDSGESGPEEVAARLVEVPGQTVDDVKATIASYQAVQGALQKCYGKHAVTVPVGASEDETLQELIAEIYSVAIKREKHSKAKAWVRPLCTQPSG